MNGKIWLRILAGLVLIAAIAGITFFAYQAGVVHGSPITVQAPNGQSQAAPYPYYGMPFYGMHGAFFPFWGFGCFAPLIALFLFFLALRAFRVLFWGPRWGGHMHMHGPWRHGWTEEGVPPMFKEMHDRAHGKQPEEKKE
jgi:hypothetical protein